MPSIKRRLKQIQQENNKVAKKNTTIASFFKESADTRDGNSTDSRPCEVRDAPPTPNADEKKKNSGHAVQFKSEWQKGRPWLSCKEQLHPDGQAYQAMFCTLCTKWSIKRNVVWVDIGCKSIRLDIVKGHEDSKQHKESVAQDLNHSETLDSVAAKMDTKEYKALLDAQKVLHFLIQHNLPHTTLFKPMIQLCVDVGATNLAHLNQGNNANYTSHRIVDEFLECQAEVVEEEVKTKLKDSESYGLMLDEYTDLSARKHLALVGKFIDRGVAKLKFLQDIQLPNGTADVIYSAMKEYLKAKDIPLKNMLTFASDGPTVMLGKKNGVVAQLKRDNPHVINVHCMNHRLQLAVSKSFSAVPKVESVDELLSALFKYYHYSTVKAESLQAIQNLMRETGDLENVNNLTVKKAVHTRWLSHENAVQTIRKLYVPICRDLENAVAEGRDKKLGDKSGIPAGALLKLLKTYEKVYFIHLLCDVCCVVGSLTRLFEMEKVDLSIITPKLQATIVNLQKMKVRAGPYTSKAEQVCKELDTAVDLNKVAEHRDKFLDLLVEKLEERLENSDLVSSLAALDLSQVPESQATFHGDQEITLLAEHIGLDPDQTLSEWNDLKEVFHGDLSSCTPSQLLKTLDSKKASVGSLYPNIMKMLVVNQTLILSTAPVERVFSRVKMVVTDHRNRLNVSTTNRLLMVGLNTSTLEDIDMDKVVRNFIEKKKRRLF